jgi:hypothetical protein
MYSLHILYTFSNLCLALRMLCFYLPGSKETKIQQHGRPLFWHYCGGQDPEIAALQHKINVQFKKDQEARHQDVAEEQHGCTGCIGFQGPCAMTAGGIKVCTPFENDKHECAPGFIKCTRAERKGYDHSTRASRASAGVIPTPAPTTSAACRCSGVTNTLGKGG